MDPKSIGRGTEPALRNGLNHFLGALKSLSPLEPAEVTKQVQDIRAREARFRQELAVVPGTAVLLLEHWRRRREQGRITGLLFHAYRDEPGGDWSAFIDERLGLLSQLVARRDALAREAAQGSRAELDAEIASVVASANILFEVLQEIASELRAVLDGPKRRSAARRRQLGLDARAQAALGRAERALAERDIARQSLAARNLRLVVHVAKRFRGQGVPFLDLIQEGAIGLLRAVDKFDAELGFRFSTYGVWWVEQAMIRAIQKHSRSVRVPANIYELHLRYREAHARLSKQGGEPSRADLAGALGISEEQVSLVASSRKRIRSIDAPVEDPDGMPLRDLLAVPDGPDPIEGHDQQRIGEFLRRGLRTLGARERQVLEWRFGLGGREPLTLQGIGERLGLSRERARQIQQEAFDKLRGQEPIRALAEVVAAGDDRIAPR